MTKRLPAGHHDENWKGYTIDELCYRRAYTVARLEIEKERLLHNIANIQDGFRASTTTRSMFSRIIGSFSYIDLGLMAFKIGKRIFKTVRRVR